LLPIPIYFFFGWRIWIGRIRGKRKVPVGLKLGWFPRNIGVGNNWLGGRKEGQGTLLNFPGLFLRAKGRNLGDLGDFWVFSPRNFFSPRV